jgi:predicted ferric reductase
MHVKPAADRVATLGLRSPRVRPRASRARRPGLTATTTDDRRARRPTARLRLPAAVLAPLYLAVALSPLAIALALSPESEGFAAELGAATGLVAAAMLSAQFLSSGRWAFLSDRAGIDRTMRFHQLAAYSLAAVVLAHPLAFLEPWRAASAAAAWADARAMFAAPHLASGVVAWFALLATVLLGALRRRLPLKYEPWRALHALGAAVAVGAGAHHALAVGGYSASPPVASLLVALAAAALGSLAFVYLVKPWLLARRPYALAANRALGPGIQELVLEPRTGRPFEYRTGQFAWLAFGRFPWPLADHPFSFASAPASGGRLRVLVKARGDFTDRVGDLAPGTPAYVDGPYGNFTLEGREGEAIALFAGGIGIAPILGILEALHAARDPRPIALVYGARLPGLVVCRDEIERLKAGLDLTTRYFAEAGAPGWDGETGPIRLDELGTALRASAPARCLCFVCGPPPMMDAVERRLLALGVPERQIVAERFEYD